jgi:hypothetical protein
LVPLAVTLVRRLHHHMTPDDAAEKLLKPLDPVVDALGDVGDRIHVVPGNLGGYLHVSTPSFQLV